MGQFVSYGLKSATPAAQYMAVPKRAAKLWAQGVPATASPTTTEATLPVDVRCGSTRYPGDVTVMAWALPWPATNPTTSSFDCDDIAVPEFAVVPVLEMPVEASVLHLDRDESLKAIAGVADRTAPVYVQGSPCGPVIFMTKSPVELLASLRSGVDALTLAVTRAFRDSPLTKPQIVPEIVTWMLAPAATVPKLQKLMPHGDAIWFH